MGWFFNKDKDVRADTKGDMVDIDTSTQDGQLLRALVSGEYAITREQALQVPAVAACVRLIGDTISTVPIRLYKVNDETRQLDEVTDDPRLQMLNVDTGDTLSAAQFKKALVRDYLLDKGGYAYIEKRGNKVKALRYIDPGYISFNSNEDPIYKDYDILVNGRTFRPYQFIKVLRNTRNGRRGISVVEENSQPIGVAYLITKFQQRLIKTGGNKKGFLKSQNRIDDKAIASLKDAWARLFSEDSENVVVLNNGMEFQQSSESSTEMQINETVNTLTKEICQIFGVSMNLLSRGETGTASREERIVFIQYCIQPILEEFVNALNRDLLLESEKDNMRFEADTSEFTKADPLERYQAYEIASRNGFMQIDEIRFKENMKPLGLDFVKMGLQDVMYYPNKGVTYNPNMNTIGGMDLAMEDRKAAKEKQAMELEIIKNQLAGVNAAPTDDDKNDGEGGKEADESSDQE
jgi:HK97 family phage portal protein